jgi:hypothetical protein
LISVSEKLKLEKNKNPIKRKNLKKLLKLIFFIIKNLISVKIVLKDSLITLDLNLIKLYFFFEGYP